MLKRVEATKKGGCQVSMQTVRQPKPDPVMKYGPWFIAALLILGVLPASIFSMYSGMAVKEGFFGLAICAGGLTFLLSLNRKEA